MNDSHSPVDPGEQVPSLSRERIIRSAIILLDAEGLAGLSMRRLADNLDAGAMSLYWYFSTKDELVRAATDATLSEIRLRNLPDGWDAKVRALATDVRAVIQRHPWLGQTLSGAPATGPHGLAVFEAFLEALAQLGLGGDQLDSAVSTILGYIQGLAVSERLWTNAFRGTSPRTVNLSPAIVNQNPRFAAFVTNAALVDPDRRFIDGINLILAGLAGGAGDVAEDRD
jgi:AcrR family transcriptional regulator